MTRSPILKRVAPSPGAATVPGDLEPGNFRVALGGRIDALALQYVRPVHARGFDLDEHLPGTRHRDWALLRHKNLGGRPCR